MPRSENSFQPTVLMVPSEFIRKLALPFTCPVSVVAETAPSVPATSHGLTPNPPAKAVKDVCTPPAHPAPPNTWRRAFHAAFAGSQTSMPMPAVVDGALAGPGWPGPTSSLTKHMSLLATGVADVAV